jgi:DNA (cytosine-5)-methyltransferase 1
MQHMQKFSFIDIFGAPGGMSLGFKMAGFKPMGVLDIFEDGLKTYASNFPEIPEKNIVKADARSLNIVEKFREKTSLKRGDVDVIIGGPPCQGFSNMGRIKIANLVKTGQRNGRSVNPRFIDDPRNNLYKIFVKFVQYYKPRAVVMENVPGMRSYKNGWVEKQVKEDLKEIGYKNMHSEILNAVNFGIPQRRKRIFFIGSRDKDAGITFPEPTHFDKDLLAKIPNRSKYKESVTVRDAISDLPRLSLPERWKKITDMVMPYKGKNLRPYQIWAREGSNGVIHNHVTRWHREMDRTIFAIMKEGGKWCQIPDKYRKKIGYSDESFDDKWKKLSYKEPSWTIVSHLHKDGYMYIHPKQRRTISVREAARIQGFPDVFVFAGSRTAQFKQVGNAVPPLLSKAIGIEVKKALAY